RQRLSPPPLSLASRKPPPTPASPPLPLPAPLPIYPRRRDRPAVHLHQPPDQRQADAQPARGPLDAPVHLGEHVKDARQGVGGDRSEEHTSELQALTKLVCRLLL